MESRHTGVDDRGSAAPRSPMAKGSESASLTDSTSKESDMPKKDKVRGWSKKDVSRWLEKRNLVKFAPLFLKHGVVGSDIVESKLSFLYTDDVMVDDRERILAEIYMLLHPDSPKLMLRPTPSLSLRSIHPKDREKYEAALQVAKSPPSRTVSPPVVFIGSRSRSPGSLTSTKTLTVPATKPRSRSESGLDVTDSSSLTPPSPGRKYLKRKSTPAVHDYLQRGTIQNASLFDTLQAEGQVCLHCVKVQRSEVGSKFGFCYQSLPDCCLLVTKVGSSSVPLQVGDRILEVDGILLPGHKGSTVESVLSKAASLDVVVVRPVSRLPEGTGQPNIEQTKLQQEVVMSEVRWQSLRQLLTSLQHKSFDPLSLTGTLTNMEDMEDTKKRVTLEMEVDELQRNCAELTSKTSELRATLRAKEEELLEVRGQRDRAVDTLRTRFMEHCGPQQPHASGSKRPQQPAAPITAVESSEDLHTLFFEHIEVNLATMERSDASKEDVLDVLRELTKATQRHAQFVDRLISFVSERAPWMIEELNALQEESEQPPDTGPPDANSDANANVNSNANVKPDLGRSGPPRVPVSRGQFDEEHAIIV